MDLIWNGIAEAFQLFISFDPEVVGITLLTFKISGTATLLSLILGVPLGTFLGLVVFRGRRTLLSLIYTGMGFPPVVIGLFVTIFLWRSGPLGFIDVLYTPTAIIIAQTIIAFPIIMGLTAAAIQNLNPKLPLQIFALGATRFQMYVMLLREARIPLLAAVAAGFGSIISEIGASLMVGGNIPGHTRVLTTATVMETAMGNFEMAIAFSIILLLLILGVNVVLTLAQQKKYF